MEYSEMDLVYNDKERENKKRNFHLTKESDKLRNEILEILQQEEGTKKIAIFQFFINRIFKIDDAAQTAEIDFYVKINWIDQKYVGVSDDDFQDKSDKFEEGWWDPGVEVSNGIELEKMIDREESFWVEDSESGMLAYTQRYIGKLYCPTNLHNFPFDCQEISILFESFHWKAEDMALRRLPSQGHQVFSKDPDFQWKTLNKDIVLTDWDIRAVSIVENIKYYAFEDRSYHQVVTSIGMRRKYGYYMTKVIFLIWLIVVMSWSVFFMEASDIAGRISIIVTLFLAEVAFNFILSSSLPKISYNTWVDQYLLISYVYVFLALVETICVFIVFQYSTVDIANTIDYICVASFFVSYTIYQMYFFIRSHAILQQQKKRLELEKPSEDKKEK